MVTVIHLADDHYNQWVIEVGTRRPLVPRYKPRCKRAKSNCSR